MGVILRGRGFNQKSGLGQFTHHDERNLTTSAQTHYMHHAMCTEMYIHVAALIPRAEALILVDRGEGMPALTRGSIPYGADTVVPLSPRGPGHCAGSPKVPAKW